MRASPNALLDKCGRVLLFLFGGLWLPVAFFLGLSQTPLQAQANVLFVDADAGGANNGSSWEDAYVTLQDALANASSDNEIWVAEGV